MKRIWLILLLLAIPLIIIYKGFSSYYFTGEDFSYLFASRYYFTPRSVLTLSSSQIWYRPVGFAFWYLNYHLSHLSVWHYYIINMFLHVVNTLLVYKLATKLSGSFRPGVWAALLFFVHPASTSTTLYLSSRFDLVGTTFVLASMALYWAFETNKNKACYALSLASAFLAMLSKEMYITVPALICILCWTNSGDIPVRAKLRQTFWKSAPFFVFAIIYMLMRMIILSGIGGYVYKRQDIGHLIVSTPINVVHSILVSVRTLVFGNLSTTGGIFTALIVLIIVSVAVFAAFFTRKRSKIRMASWVGVLLASVSILPVLNFPDFLGSSLRFFYLPLAGTVIFLASLFNSKLVSYLLVIPLLFWLWGSYSMSSEWKEVSDRERLEATRTVDYLHPLVKNAPPNTKIILFGLDPAGFNLDFATKALWPKDTSSLPYPHVLGLRFLYGDRVSLAAGYKGLGMKRSKRHYKSKADDLSDEDFLILDSGNLFTEMVKPPDIPKELSSGENIIVVGYSKDKGFKEITSMFRELLEDRLRLGKLEGLPQWEISMDETWKPGGDLSRKSTPGNFKSDGTDPYMEGPAIDLQAIGIAGIELKMKVTPQSTFSPEITEGQILWESSKNPPWNLKRRLNFPVIADGTMRTYRINLGRSPAWYFAGNIEKLRIDPVTYPAEIEITQIKLISQAR